MDKDIVKHKFARGARFFHRGAHLAYPEARPPADPNRPVPRASARTHPRPTRQALLVAEVQVSVLDVVALSRENKHQMDHLNLDWSPGWARIAQRRPGS